MTNTDKLNNNQETKYKLYAKVDRKLYLQNREFARGVNMNMTEYLNFLFAKNVKETRSSAVNSNGMTLKLSEYDPNQTKAIVREINYIGNNINQISKTCHSLYRLLETDSLEKYGDDFDLDNHYREQFDLILDNLAVCREMLGDIYSRTYVKTADEILQKLAPMVELPPYGTDEERSEYSKLKDITNGFHESGVVKDD